MKIIPHSSDTLIMMEQLREILSNHMGVAGIYYGGEVQYRFWNPADDQTITIPQPKTESE